MRLQTKRPAGYRGKRRLAWWKVLAALVLAGILVFAGLFGAVMYGSYNHIQDDPQVMVILGCRVMPEGHPSILLQDRLDTALDYWEEHQDITIVTSGGQGSNEPVSEARCMADYLMDGGVPEDQILLEDQSHNTKENFLYSKELLADEGIITRMPFPVERYDADTRPHPHFCCDECGSVYDLDLPYDQEVDQRARMASGHDVTGHQVTFHGVCAQCRRTEKQVV